MASSLNDAEVDKQIRHMIAFIHQEAKEKAEEIRVKAEEEFNIEKMRILQQEKIKIMHHYERKEKLVETEKKIQHSKALNVARVQVLQKQDELVKSIYSEAEKRLLDISNDKSKYSEILENLLTEGLMVLLEEKVEVRVRKGDVDLIKGLLKKSSKAYTDATHKNVEITVNEKDNLPETSGGGVVLSANKGKIQVKNTLRDRINNVTDKILPAVREKLFGVSQSRTFFDEVM